MSKDFLLKHVCPHRTKREWLSIASDYRTINTIQPPASKDIELRWNRYVVPKSGLEGPVEFATDTEPFEIEKGSTDELVVNVNETGPQTLTLPPGNNVTAATIAARLEDQIDGLAVRENERRVEFMTYRSGDNATVFLRGGSGHTALGLPETRLYHGTKNVPSWQVVRPPNPIDDVERLIEFSEPLKTRDDIIEVSYFTRRQDCRRCNGLGIEDDIRFDDRGEPIFVDGIDLLVQEVEKITFTIKGSNIFHEWYGTSIVDLIGTKIASGGRVVQTQIASELGATLQRYRNVKIQQESLQPVSNQEFPLQINRIDVQQDPFDPTVFNVEIEVRNRAQEVDRIEQRISIEDAPVAISQSGFRRVT